ncbi:FCD domain-containing protein [Shinella sp. AETb1-6]|uniref:FadR/GntR family transcriptional regulator n=1 Tax=Shinella sp. AETb1-6 TaxID=2692210 RepID=UPI00136A6B20|nr:FadR/GntR family transcriptional regulator [Shinella sp. AETb1-6]MXN53252.1 FCD domain-containing protein [Shinella sp. AETb1-6]
MADLSGKHIFSEVNRPEPLHLRVAALIGQQIDRGALGPGDRLPKEQELALQFNVGRNVIREAIACLRADGILGSRQGVGAYVLAPHERQSFRIDPKGLHEPENIRALLEMRLPLEVQAAGLAADRRTSSQSEHLRSIYVEMVASEHWSPRAIDLDMEFHRSIAAAAHNGYLVNVLTLISHHTRQTIEQALDRNELGRLVHSTEIEHEAVLLAIERRDAPAARAAMETHIRSAATRLGVELT